MKDNEKRESVDDSCSSACYPLVCNNHRFRSWKRLRCPYCDLEAGLYLAIGSRDNASALADIIRDQNRGAAETLDHLADNFDRLGEIIGVIKDINEQRIQYG